MTNRNNNNDSKSCTVRNGQMQMEGNSGTYTVATTILVVLQLQQ